MAGESVNTVVETQATEAVLDASAIASDSVAVSDTAAGGDSVVVTDTATVGDSAVISDSAIVSDTAVVGDGPGDTVCVSTVSVSTVSISTVSVSDGPGAAEVATAGPDALDEADAFDEADALDQADALDAPEGTDADVTDANDTGEPDHDLETDDSGAINIKADGEPPDVSERRINVTETLTVDALIPEIAFAPEAVVPEVALSTRAAWDAADAVTEIYRSHYSQLVRLSVLLVHDVQTAEEVVQEAFEAMHQAWKRLRDSEKALQYLRQTVVNKSRSVLRHRKVVDLHAPKPAPDEPSAEQAALAILERSAVAAALRSLPERQREAIALRYYADFSEADIAAAMGISRGAVKSHTARAMAALKSILTQETP